MSKRSGSMLCYPFEEKRLRGQIRGSQPYTLPYIVQAKLDGERCRAVYSVERHVMGYVVEKVTLLSSTEEVIISVPHINEQLLAPMRTLFKELGINEVDGELYIHRMPFEQIHSIVSREYDSTRHPDYESMKYHIFDIVCQERQYKRCQLLMAFYALCQRENAHNIDIVNTYEEITMEGIMDAYEQCIEQGYEGIVVRNSVGMYERKRSRDCMKFKPKAYDDYDVVDIEEAVDVNGEGKGMAGAFVCEKDGERFNVGAGHLDHIMRQIVWERKQKYVGKSINIQYQTLTEKGVPRFALAVRFNTTKVCE